MSYTMMSNEEYHSRPELSASQLKKIFDDAQKTFMSEDDKLEGVHIDIGNAVHKLLLEEDDFFKEFAVAPKVDKRTKKGKQEWADFEREHDGKTVLKQDDYEMVKSIHAGFKEYFGETLMFSSGVAEASFFGELMGTPVRCRPDFFNEDAGVIIDLKTTRSAKPEIFRNDIYNLNYHLQAAFYVDLMRSLGYEINEFIFIAVEKTEPYMMSICKIDAEGYSIGKAKYIEAIEKYKNKSFYESKLYKDDEGNVIHELGPTYLETVKHSHLAEKHSDTKIA